MGRENRNTMMEAFTKALLLMDKKKGQESISGKMEEGMKETSKMVLCMEED